MSRSPIQTFQEHPILFSGPLVRAILSGEKTQTRRLVRHPRGEGWRPVGKMIRTKADLSDPAFRWDRAGAFGATQWVEDRCPYGKPGDRLWVRETWRLTDFASYDTDRYSAAVEMRADGARPFRKEGGPEMLHERCDWRPSIHMPRWASRISLEVTDVRVQRLRDITDEDACAEGVTPDCRCEGGCDTCSREGVDYFRDVWEALAPDGSKWADNPWVWAVSFKMVQP